jgi:hypothetical protein
MRAYLGVRRRANVKSEDNEGLLAIECLVLNGMYQMKLRLWRCGNDNRSTGMCGDANLAGRRRLFSGVLMGNNGPR